MRRYFKKIISFTLSVIFIFTIVSTNNTSVANASVSTDYHVEMIANNEYTDGMNLGDGFILLKNGRFNNITKETQFFYFDEYGNRSEIKNTSGFTGMHVAFSPEFYFNDLGVLAVEKNGAYALMDNTGELFGGTKNYYACLEPVNNNLFYTTDDAKNGYESTTWTLRKRNGEAIKTFNNFSIIQRQYKNGYEYVQYNENGVDKISKISENGTITELVTGNIQYFYISKGGKYISVHLKKYNGTNEIVLTTDGKKVLEFDFQYSHEFNIDKLEECGYGELRYFTPGISGARYNFVDINGNYLLEKDKYTRLDYDSERILAVDQDGGAKLIDYKGNVIFDCNKFINEIGMHASYVTYTKGVLAISLSEYMDSGRTYFFNKNGQVIANDLYGEIQSFNGKYAVLRDNYNSNYILTDVNGNEIRNVFNYINLEYYESDETNLIIGYEHDYLNNTDNIILSDGTVIEKYDSVSYSWSEVIEVWKDNKRGLINRLGQEIVPCGGFEDYKEIGRRDESYNFEWINILAISNNDIQTLVDKNGNEIKTPAEYLNITEYATVCGTYVRSKLSKTNMEITVDTNGKVGLIQFRKGGENNKDVTGDGIIDIKDVSEVAKNYNTTSKSSNWNYKCDLNYDEIIDLYDVTTVSKKVK